jgi:predicted nucleotidyltransferase
MSTDRNSGLGLSVIKELHRVFSRYPEIQTAILYGSRAKGSFKPSSDIDLCLTAPDLTYSQFMKVSTELDDLLLPYSIDLSLRHHIENKELIEHIERIGIPVSAMIVDAN